MRKLLYFVITAVVLVPTMGQAYPLEYSLFLPTDTASLQFFALNPASYSPKSYTLAYGELYRQTSIKNKTETSNTNQEIKNDIEARTHSFGVMNKLGGAISLGAIATYDREIVYSNLDTSRTYREADADEFFVKKEGTALFNVDFTPSFRIGISYKYTSIKNEILGSFGVDRDDFETIKGSGSRLTAGALLSAGTMGVGFLYRLPMRGKVTAISEEKLTSDSGLIAANLHYEFFKELRGGVALLKWTHEKDELSATTTNSDRRNIFLKGLNTEARLYPLETLTGGFDYSVSQAVTLRVGGSVEQYQFADDPLNVKSTAEGKSDITSYRGKAGVNVAQTNVNLWLGAEYSPRKYSKDGVTHTATDTGINGAVSVNF